MSLGVLIVSAILAAAQVKSPNHEAKPRSAPLPPLVGAAERIVLRDGSTVLGMVIPGATGARGSLEVVVRREWARTYLPTWTSRWERSVETSSKQAVRQRRERLAAWKNQRTAGRDQGDRILAWIDQERTRLEDPDLIKSSTLLPVHLPRGDFRTIEKQPETKLRLLQLGWLNGLPEVETMPPDTLKSVLEGRGFVVDGVNTPAIDRLLPLTPETELMWLARRAATEILVDPDLRFVRYQNVVAPDAQGGQGQELAMGGLNLSSALGELSRLLDPQANEREDPLLKVVTRIGESGRVGVVVTRLEMAPDFSQSKVESVLWVKTGPSQWVPFVRREATVRPEEVDRDAGAVIAEDPQVKSAYSLVEGLGLGKIPQELKDRSLKMGAATQKALGVARAAISEDLNRLMLPIFAPADDRPGPLREQPADKRPALDHADTDASRQARPTARKAGP